MFPLVGFASSMYFTNSVRAVSFKFTRRSNPGQNSFAICPKVSRGGFIRISSVANLHSRSPIRAARSSSFGMLSLFSGPTFVLPIKKVACMPELPAVRK